MAELPEALAGLIDLIFKQGVVVTPHEDGWLVRLADESESTLEAATISRSW
jgi:hypothetical protein